jgi:hypothetical protein
VRLVPYLALTGHKVQGQSLSSLVLVPHARCSKEWYYVVFSRLISGAGLHIDGEVPSDKASYHDNPFVRSEQDRLRVLHYQHLIRDCADRRPRILEEARRRLILAEQAAAKSEKARDFQVQVLLAARADKNKGAKQKTSTDRVDQPLFQFK